MRIAAALARFFGGLLRELSDEAAYARYLQVNGRMPSAEEWKRFTDLRYSRKYSNAKCC